MYRRVLVFDYDGTLAENDRIPAELVSAIEQAGVPLERGFAIVSTWSVHEEIVAQVISRSGSDAVLAHNKGAIMILPPGAAKGTGLERMLELCSLSARNAIIHPIGTLFARTQRCLPCGRHNSNECFLISP